MTIAPKIVQVAVPVPLRRVFDYSIPSGMFPPAQGMRVKVPFGKRKGVTGLVVEVKSDSEVSEVRLKPIAQVLDQKPIFTASLLGLLTWAADYYHHPIGEVFAAAMPARLRQRSDVDMTTSVRWRMKPREAPDRKTPLRRSVVLKRLIHALETTNEGLDAAALAALSTRWRLAISELEKQGWVERFEHDPAEVVKDPKDRQLELSDAQAAAVRHIVAADGFAPILLYGVTGSGKTEVYLRAIEEVLARDQQALVLVPEIGLTPQLVARFRERLDEPLVVLHSDLSDKERVNAWLAAGEGKARIVVGTRSAVFTPFARLGLIVVDEEHDASFKQQDGFRYSARDLAVMRANREGIPVVLGSATPSLETIGRVQAGIYTQIVLPHRVAGAALPAIEVLDMRRFLKDEGLSHPLRVAIAETLRRKEQTLLFLNRRGFAPAWMCFACGWAVPCRRCDARLTYHRNSARLRCHHCGAEQPMVTVCESCGTTGMRALGEGTERIEAVLERLFPDAEILRIDRDSTRTKGSLEEKLNRARRGEADILVGTQMLSKGHDFPNVTLVGVLNADQGIYGSDFRASERLVQQIVQVSGRAGRADKPGRVLIQTHQPMHPVFETLQTQGYDRFAEYALLERRETGYPPFGYIALMRAESTKADAALAFLRTARVLARRCAEGPDVQIMEPVPSPMERRAGRYRAQLLLQSKQRGPLHALLRRWLDGLSEHKAARRVRWSIDVDPVDLY